MGCRLFPAVVLCLICWGWVAAFAGLPDGRLAVVVGFTGLVVERLEASVLEGCAGGVFLVWRFLAAGWHGG
jgi:hypothetical protein